MDIILSDFKMSNPTLPSSFCSNILKDLSSHKKIVRATGSLMMVRTIS